MWIVRGHFRLAGRDWLPGEEIPLAELVPAWNILEREGKIIEEETDEPLSQDWALALKDLMYNGYQYVAGQYVPLASVEDVDRLLATGLLHAVRESDPFKKSQSYSCLDPECHAMFVSAQARRAHSALFDHRKRYPEHIKQRRKQVRKNA